MVEDFEYVLEILTKRFQTVVVLQNDAGLVHRALQPNHIKKKAQSLKHLLDFSRIPPDTNLQKTIQNPSF